METEIFEKLYLEFKSNFIKEAKIGWNTNQEIKLTNGCKVLIDYNGQNRSFFTRSGQETKLIEVEFFDAKYIAQDGQKNVDVSMSFYKRIWNDFYQALIEE